jgi:hypothetical protein
MTKEIGIQVERQNHGDWIKVHLPYHSDSGSFAVLQNEHGEILKRVKLEEGSNSIDISYIKGDFINIKVETPWETILKKIKICV